MVRPHAAHLVRTEAIGAPQLEFTRNYAKAKKIKEKAKSKGGHIVHLTDERLQEIINVDGYRTKMEKTIQKLEDDFIKNLSLRSTTGSIETVRVKFDGEEHELQDIAQIVRKNPKTIIINMTAFPQAITAALKALEKSGMNLNPQQDGTTIFVPVPKVTKEHRSNLAKGAKVLFTKCREHIKDAQTEVIRKIKNNKKIAEDENHSAQAQVTEMADVYVAQAEKMLDTKQKELLGN